MNNSQKKFLYYFHRDVPSKHRLHQKRLSIDLNKSKSTISQDSRSIPKLQVSSRTKTPTRNDRQRIPFHLYNLKKNQKTFNNENKKNSSVWNFSQFIQPPPSDSKPGPNIFDVISQNISISETSEASLDSNILPQPGTRFFLCKNCYEFYLTLQIKQHNKLCKFYCTSSQYEEKWQKLSELLKTVATQVGYYRISGFYDLGQQMDKSLSNGKIIDMKKIHEIQKNGYFKNNFFNMRDIFWVIEEIAMKLRSSEGKRKKKMLWMPCKGDCY